MTMFNISTAIKILYAIVYYTKILTKTSSLIWMTLKKHQSTLKYKIWCRRPWWQPVVHYINYEKKNSLYVIQFQLLCMTNENNQIFDFDYVELFFCIHDNFNTNSINNTRNYFFLCYVNIKVGSAKGKVVSSKVFFLRFIKQKFFLCTYTIAISLKLCYVMT